MLKKLNIVILILLAFYSNSSAQLTKVDNPIKRSVNDVYLRSTSYNMGIGISSPTEKLDVNGTTKIRGTGSSILFDNGKSINGDTAGQLTFNGNIEIDAGNIYSLGTAGLTKTSTNNNAQVLIRKSGGYALNAAGLAVIGTSDFGGTIVMAQDRNAALTSGKYLGQLLFTGSYEASHNLQNGGAAIFGVATGTWSATANPSKLTFEIGASDVFYRLQRMQITPTGTTIGTNNTTISALLSVGDSAPTKTYIDGTNDLIVKDAIEANGTVYADSDLIVGGNTGIGTSSPSTKLHVVGGARITGLVSCDTIDTDANGVLACGTDGGGGGGTWGSITGTLSAQTDLNTELGLKAPLDSPTFTTFLKLPNSANPTVDAAGKIAVDTSATTGSAIRFYGDATYTLPAYQRMSFTIEATTASSDYELGSFPANITIRAIRVFQVGATNVVGGLQECNSNGASCSAVDSDITATTTTATDDGSLTNPTIDANDQLQWLTSSVSGTNTRTVVTIYYTYDAVN